jgi:hypothetical protein
MKSNEVSFRDREAATAALVGRVLFARTEINQSDYPALMPCELRELLKFWIEVAVSIDYYRFLTGNVDPDHLRCRDLAWNRVDQIQKVLGQEEEEDALAEVRNRLGQYEDPRYWDVFWGGTPEEKKAAQEEVRRLEPGRIHREAA